MITDRSESCVYITHYGGDKMPPKYIGSSYSYKIDNGSYHGSVSSKKWQKIWESELLYHPELFRSEVILRFSNREDATDLEEIVQKKLDVVNSEDYINMAYAKKGFSLIAVVDTRTGKETAITKEEFDSNNYYESRSGVFKRTEEMNNQMSISCKKAWTSERKETFSELRKGEVHKIVKCPHCGEEGGYSAMQRWHFERCELNPDRVELESDKIKTCPHCGTQGRGGAMVQWHFDNCIGLRKKPTRRRRKIQVYDKNDNFVKEYNTMKDVLKNKEFRNKNTIYASLAKEDKLAYGYNFKYGEVLS